MFASLPTPAAPTDSPMGNVSGMMQGQPAFGSSSSDDLARQQRESGAKQVQAIGQGLDSLAKQFPAAAKGVEAAKEQLVKILTMIVGSPMQPGSSPTGVMG